MVITGKAGLQVMGDWAKGEFIARRPDRRQGIWLRVLGADGGYVMGGDVFVFPKIEGRGASRRRRSSSRSLMLDPATQLAFNTKKGSVPVAPRRRRLEHGRLRAEGRRAAEGPEASSCPASRYLISPD